MKKWNKFLHILKSCWLCIRFPFLYPRNIFTEKPISYIPTYTMLDIMKPGWKKAFGIQMCKELRKQLIKEHYLFKYRITQIKEKSGYLNWYDNGHSNEIRKIISKYENLSWNTCLVCGKPATKISFGWISPYCNEHYPTHLMIYKEKINNEWVETKEYKKLCRENGIGI